VLDVGSRVYFVLLGVHVECGVCGVWGFGFGVLEVWKFWSLEAWKFGSLEVWEFGSLEFGVGGLGFRDLGKGFWALGFRIGVWSLGLREYRTTSVGSCRNTQARTRCCLDAPAAARKRSTRARITHVCA